MSLIHKRATNPELLKSYRSRPCAICSRRGCDPHHIRTRGAGGPDEEWNLMPLCRIHHTEIHQIGIISFCLKYKQAINFLLAHGWTFLDYKLVRLES